LSACASQNAYRRKITTCGIWLSKVHTHLSLLCSSWLIAFSINPVSAAEIEIKITNITHGVYFTPLLVSAHDDSTHLFEAGTAASTNLQTMAEGGDISGLSTDLSGVSADIVENPAGGLLSPGDAATAVMNTTAGNTHLSIVAMLLPTNDGFVGLDALEIPAAAGTYIYFINGYDAGTEANNELINGGGAPGVLGIPFAPGADGGTGGTGVTATETNTKVHIHRGVLGDSNATGGTSDLNNTVHRWLNPVAKVEMTVQ
jgi:spondin N